MYKLSRACFDSEWVDFWIKRWPHYTGISASSLVPRLSLLRRGRAWEWGYGASSNSQILISSRFSSHSFVQPYERKVNLFNAAYQFDNITSVSLYRCCQAWYWTEMSPRMVSLISGSWLYCSCSAILCSSAHNSNNISIHTLATRMLTVHYTCHRALIKLVVSSQVYKLSRVSFVSEWTSTHVASCS